MAEFLHKCVCKTTINQTNFHANRIRPCLIDSSRAIALLQSITFQLHCSMHILLTAFQYKSSTCLRKQSTFLAFYVQLISFSNVATSRKYITFQSGFNKSITQRRQLTAKNKLHNNCKELIVNNPCKSIQRFKPIQCVASVQQRLSLGSQLITQSRQRKGKDEIWLLFGFIAIYRLIVSAPCTHIYTQQAFLHVFYEKATAPRGAGSFVISFIQLNSIVESIKWRRIVNAISFRSERG